MYTRSLLTVSTQLVTASVMLPVGVLLECQHLCTLPVQPTLFFAMRLAYLYPLPLLFTANPIRETLLPAGAGGCCWKAPAAQQSQVAREATYKVIYLAVAHYCHSAVPLLLMVQTELA